MNFIFVRDQNFIDVIENVVDEIKNKTDEK